MSRVWPASRISARDSFLLAVITLLAAFFRLYRLDQIPPGFHFDQSFYVFDALRLLQGQFSIFFAAPGGSEPLYPYLATVGVAILGPGTPLGLKITSALLGIITIPLIYLLAQALFRSSRIAVLAALFTCISSWHIYYSRDGERLTLMVLFVILTFIYLWRALDQRRSRDFALAGLFLGLDLYTYLAARVMPLVVIFLLAFAIWQDRTHWRDYIQGGARMVVLAALVFLPLGVYYLLHPGDFISHTAQVSIFTSQTDIAHALSDNALRLFGMFVWRGDPGIIRNVPGKPIFDPFVGGLFLVGVVVWGAALARPGVAPRARRRAVLIALWIGLALALSMLSDDAPNNGRVFIAIPAVMLLPAWGASACWERLRTSVAHKAGAAVLAAIVLASGFVTFRDYFTTFADSPDLYYAFNVDLVEVADWINANQGAQHIFLAPLLYQQGTISLLTRVARLKSFDSRDTVVLPARARGQDAIFGFPLEQAPRVQTLASRLGTLGARDDLPGSNGARLIWLYRVPASNLPDPQNPLNVLRLGGAFVQPQTTGHVMWGNQMELLGQSIGPEGPGGRNLTVTLFLHGLDWMPQDYTFSVRARDALDRIWGQEDKFPGDNSYPTSLWDPGDLVIEKFYPGLDPCAPAGEYRLTVEAYNFRTQEGLTTTGGGQTIALGSTLVGASQGNRLQDLEPAHSLDLDLSPQLHLLGLTELQPAVRAGDPISLELFWKGNGNGANLPVTLVLRDASGNAFKLADRIISLPGEGRGLCTLFDVPIPAQASPGPASILLNDTPIDSI
ncbi:MAG: glycosyltransferase family 39 protein, partial [Anaerolineae bacterium]